MKWISVKDKLPEKIIYPSGYEGSEDVLLANIHGEYGIGSYDFKMNFFVDAQCSPNMGYDPTHWMPLPELPQLPLELDKEKE